jgi:putative hemolysin
MIRTRAAIISLTFLVAVAAMGLSRPLSSAKSFSVTCATTATAITGSGVDGYASVYCDNNSTTSVFVGGSDVGTSGICISKDSANCPRRDLPADFEVGSLYCRVASGTQAINCLTGKL